MPRRNNRKHYKNEGKLGFDPNKYISGNGKKPMSPSPPKYAVCVSYENRPAANRHKAQKCTTKKRRAMKEIRQLERKADQVKVPQTHKTNNYASLETSQIVSTASCAQPAMAQITIKSIIGGIKHWIKTVLPA